MKFTIVIHGRDSGEPATDSIAFDAEPHDAHALIQTYVTWLIEHPENRMVYISCGMLTRAVVLPLIRDAQAKDSLADRVKSAIRFITNGAY